MGQSETEKVPKVTKYVILQLAEKGGGWFTVAGVDGEPIEAGSSDLAIQRHLDNQTMDEGELVGQTFIAVPTRSWRPRKLGGVDEVPAKRQFKLG